MSAAFALDDYHKPLPSPGRAEKFDKLPPPPPDAVDSVYLPPLPPKITHDSDLDPPGSAGLLPPIPTLPSLGSLDHTLNVPLTPTSPNSSAPPSPSAIEKSKKSNPLIDLIETEKLYVDQLTGIIRKVAGAWSRSNLPPTELDGMFRSVESVYKANRSLLSRLKDIGTNPSSPKALGDLLMRWIDDLETPYTTYCNKYCAGFDVWQPIVSNARLPKVLANFSALSPPPLSAVPPSDSGEPPLWTLDALFLLPKGRLKYYRKLYSRLLKSTTPGRSDHRLLLGALDKLDRLMTTLESREDIQVSSLTAPSAPTPAEEVEDEVVIDLRTQSVLAKSGERGQSLGSESQSRQSDFRGSQLDVIGSATSSTRASSRSSGERLSRETASTSISRASTATISRPISDLERRLSTDRTLDIFTMKPKAVRLQMAPPSLTFLREMRYSADVSIRLTPRATGEEVVHRQGHVFILSDLFLVCERMTPEERVNAGGDGPDMWLLYPPLAGKVLRVSESDQDDTMQVIIMRKETLILQTDSIQLRNTLFSEFKECIAFASSLPPPSKEAPPPLPPLPGMPRSPSAPIPSPTPETSPRTPPMPNRGSGESSNASPHDQRSSSGPPSARQSSEPVAFPPRRFDSRSQGNSPQGPNTGLISPNLVLSPEAQVQQGVGRVPSLHDLPGPMYPSRKSSTAQSFPGQESSSISVEAMPPLPGRHPSLGLQHPDHLVRQPPQNQGYRSPPIQDFRPPPNQDFRPSPNQDFRPPPNQDFRPPNQDFRPPPNQEFRSSPNQDFRPPPNQDFRPPSNQDFRPPPSQGFRPPPNQDFRSPPTQGYGLPPNIGRGPPTSLQQPHSNHPSNHQFPSQQSSYGSPPGGPGPPPPGGLRQSPSSRSLGSQYERGPPGRQPPLPPMPPGGSNGYTGPRAQHAGRANSFGSLQAPQPRTLLPSAQMNAHSSSQTNSFVEPSPPNSPVEETPLPTGPVTSTVSAQMKCKVFLKREHAQWKSLGSAKLKLYREDPTNVKQLVVEADDRHKSVLISTIVLTDGVERVGKTGVAVELSDKGSRTGIVYMIQLRNETSAGGLFDSLLAGSDRAGRG